ncbi:MAG: DNA recombination protein RmuC [Saprospiraceae bacterium]|nr:DNA recombination protein RmuC [Saprospiraceae bacterium]
MEQTTILFIILGVLSIIVILLLLQRTNGGENVPRALLAKEEARVQSLQATLDERENMLREAQALLATREEQLRQLQSRNQDWLQQQRQLHTEFENLANRLLEEKSRSFTEQNARQLQAVLTPLKEKIQEFEVGIERKFLEETREKSSLKQEIAQLAALNQQLSQDAHNLTGALRGQSKVQGDWGELQLEVLLEKAGLEKGTHFTAQASFRDEDGAAKRPDFIIQLPENRQLIIDAKVSLTAYERFYTEQDVQQREQHLRAHVSSIRSHIDNLSRKNYQQLYQINTPDYLLLFIPLDSALHTAAQADPRLFTDALDRNVVLVSTGSLLATVRTVAHLWKQEKQNRSVLEIARQSGLLYDKFVAFVEDLRAVGARLDAAQGAWSDAMNKLNDSAKFGDTLVGRAERIRQLGAKASKLLPEELLGDDTPAI